MLPDCPGSYAKENGRLVLATVQHNQKVLDWNLDRRKEKHSCGKQAFEFWAKSIIEQH